MPPIGETLREARLRRGVEISEVSAHTKIRTKYLRALESEDFDALPGPTYVRTFLRTYAEYLGLDPHLLVEEYRAKQSGVPDDEQITPFAPTPSSARARRPPGVPSGPRVGPGALAAGVVVALILLFLVIGVFTEPEDDPGVAGVTSPAATSPDEPRQPRDRDEPEQRRQKPEAVELTVRPDGPTYLCVDDGRGNVVFEETIDAPERFRGKQLRINMGRAAGQVIANGERVEIEPSPNPVGFAFEPGRVRELGDGERPCQ